MTSFFLCCACGTQHPALAGDKPASAGRDFAGAGRNPIADREPAAGQPPDHCPICDDERQYIPDATGQQFTTLDELRRTHRNEFLELEPGLTSIRTTPRFAIAQHALLVETPAGNVLWDCIPLLDDATVAEIRRRGPVVAIAISHPHFYSTMIEWSRALDNAPIYTHAADQHWVQRPDPAVRPWRDTPPPLPGGLSLVHTGGHFAGSQVLHWPAGANGKGALLAGDEPNICSDSRFVTFMRSFPNYIPLAAREAERVAAALLPLSFDRIYGWNPDRILRHDARSRIHQSLDRHLRALRGEHGPD